MSANNEIRVNQKNSLFDLLIIKREADRAGVSLFQLEQTIARTKAAMEVEDVAYVNEMVMTVEK
ncbi:MAG: hypothetical protein FWH05_08300 [Oscillospiraceae bacterium]|nr:hypothetical protein [Oscillospiraceae bacterium]